jgi:hypothetical protein
MKAHYMQYIVDLYGDAPILKLLKKQYNLHTQMMQQL